MGRFVLRRLIQAIPTCWDHGPVVFDHSAAPGGPAAALTFDPKVPSSSARHAGKLGSRPIPVQYVRWLLGERPIKVLGITRGRGRSSGVRSSGISGRHRRHERRYIRLDFGRSLFYKRPVVDMLKPARAPRYSWRRRAGARFWDRIPVGICPRVARGVFDNSSRVLAVVFNAVPVFGGVMLI